MEDKVKGGIISKMITQEDGHPVEYTHKILIEQILAKYNMAKYHVTEGGGRQLFTKEYITGFGLHEEGGEIQSVLNDSTC